MRNLNNTKSELLFPNKPQYKKFDPRLINYMSNSVEMQQKNDTVSSIIEDIVMNTTSNINHDVHYEETNADAKLTSSSFELDEKKETSGVLSYDQVKDIIVYHDFQNVSSLQQN